jgi:hypothetical protein
MLPFIFFATLRGVCNGQLSTRQLQEKNKTLKKSVAVTIIFAVFAWGIL